MKIIENYRSMLKRFRHNEHFDFFRRIIEFILAQIAVLKDLTGVWEPFHNAFVREDIIYKRSLKALETKVIKEIHGRRGDAFLVVKYGVESAAHSEDPLKSGPAAKLLEVLETYRKVTTAAMTEVSTLVYNLVQDLKTARYAQSVIDLGLTDAVDKLEALNKEFDAVYDERMQNANTYDEQGTMKDIRVVVDNAFGNFTKAVNDLYGANKLMGNSATAALYGAIIDFINADITQYQHIIARRYPGHIPGGNTGKPGDEIPPADEVLTLAISDQLSVGSAGSGGKYGAQMRIDITEVAAFAQLLAPAVVGATLRLTADDINDYPDFPVAALYYEDPQDLPTGILVDPPNTGLVYTKPLSKLGDCRAEIYKAEEHLATLTGVQYPSTIGW